MGKVELRIEIDEALIARAKAAGLDPSALAEKALKSAVERQSDSAKAQAWAEENAVAIAAHRERIEKYGVFGDDLRTW